MSFNGGNIISSPVNRLQFPDNAVYTGASASSHVIGTVSKAGNDAFAFPVGAATTLNAVAMTAPAAASEFSAQYNLINPNTVGDTSARAATLLRISGCEYWDIQRVAGTSNVSLTFDFGNPCGSAGSMYILDPTKARIAHWNGSIWEDLGNGGSTGTTSGTISTLGPITNFSPFTFGSTDLVAAPLPLSLLAFNATAKTNTVDLNWRTENELNSANFGIERSTDGRNFIEIATIAAKNTAGQNAYNAPDNKPAGGSNYYRLKLVDLDGRFTYSNIEKADFMPSTVITVAPNPAHEFIVINNIRVGDIISITDVHGRLFSRQKAVSGTLEIKLYGYAAGTYFVHVTNDSVRYTKQFIKR